MQGQSGDIRPKDASQRLASYIRIATNALKNGMDPNEALREVDADDLHLQEAAVQIVLILWKAVPKANSIGSPSVETSGTLPDTTGGGDPSRGPNANPVGSPSIEMPGTSLNGVGEGDPSSTVIEWFLPGILSGNSASLFSLFLMPPIPSFDLTDGARLTEAFGRYCQNTLRRRFDSKVVPIPTDITPGLRAEGVQIVNVVEKAWDGMPLVLKWNLSDYFRDQVNASESHRRETQHRYAPLGKRCSTGLLPLITDTQLFVDASGNVGLWYLPGILSRQREENMLRALKAFSDHAQTCLAKLPEDEGLNRYQESPSFALASGVTSLSLLKYAPSINRPGASREFLGSSAPPTLQLLQDTMETFVVLGGIIAVTQPWLFDAGLSILEMLHGRRIPVSDPINLRRVIGFWTSPFTTFDLIINRETVPQRNIQSPWWAYDLVWTLGNHNGRLECPGLGYRFLVQGGTILVGVFGCLEFGIAPSRGEQVNIICSSYEKVLDLSPHHFNPNPPTLSKWQRFFSQSDVQAHGISS
ncbi:hypothetical protein CC1G_12948 [Coprinopsis cinerea okayama7|uniref:2OGFeDO JBP1/TET oxygenase domain-containing protein n=1 Tax=Coprinopsis cinerea (strain Okayama-7 / 130 / ATCC MYA-4618 / FGSC 9003) TaxID=240176 RepID=A8P066_COPC7|nr:hypothetical protein CC1G_12948 [Coprinopsis cinerea okayama7\|eukprot:XP_001837825.2 hypothetical protein CC1G_12948 [Coprinopsis cinerea okayama7\